MTGTVAFVTGGASGIGLACVERLLATGWQVAAYDIGDAALEAIHQRYQDTQGLRIRRLDVTDEAAVKAEVGAVEREFGPIAGVVNSAGIAADLHVFKTPVELFRRILDINVVGSFIVGRAVAEHMRARRAGSIVNVASVSGVRGSKGRSAYGASKGAVITMTQSMANDLARYDIRVNAVAPGPIDTAMTKAIHDAATRALWSRHVPMRRYGSPAEVASVVEFLLDPARSGYVTAEIIAVDGGFRGAGIIADD